MLKSKARTNITVAILSVLAIASGATLLASSRPAPTVPPPPCQFQVCDLNRECVGTETHSNCTVPGGGTACNDSPPCSG